MKNIIIGVALLLSINAFAETKTAQNNSAKTQHSTSHNQADARAAFGSDSQTNMPISERESKIKPKKHGRHGNTAMSRERIAVESR